MQHTHPSLHRARENGSISQSLRCLAQGSLAFKALTSRPLESSRGNGFCSFSL